MSKLRSKIVFLGVVASAVLALGLGAVLSLMNSDTICRGVSIDGVNVAGMTKEEAQVRIRSVALTRMTKSVSLISGSRRWSAQLRDLGVRADVTGAVDKAYAIGRDGSVLIRLWNYLSGPGTNVPLTYLVDPKKLDDTLDKIAKTVDYPHKDAKLSVVDGQFVVEPDHMGYKIDRKESLKLLQSAVEAGESSCYVKVIRDLPDVTAADLSRIDTVLASYTTRFPAWRKDRTHNIRTATSKVDGTVIKPGEVFSYNDTVGPRLKSLGYRDAPIFVKGKLVPGTGGGICQLSSTIYNAALLANLKIVERSHHSSTVPYVAAGRDATVAYGLLDLRFRNTTSAPIYISSKMKGSNLRVDFYGASCDKADVAIEVAQPSKLKATVYRIVKLDGKVVTRERVSRDTYKPAEPMELAETAPKKRAKIPTHVQPARRTAVADGSSQTASM